MIERLGFPHPSLFPKGGGAQAGIARTCYHPVERAEPNEAHFVTIGNPMLARNRQVRAPTQPRDRLRASTACRLTR